MKLKRIFFASIQLMGLLRIPEKFLVIALIFISALAAVGFRLYVQLNRSIEATQSALEGIASVKSVIQTMQLVQRHRGLSSGLLGGNALLKTSLEQNEIETMASFQLVDRTIDLHDPIAQDWRQISADWDRVRKAGMNWLAHDNFIAHTQLLEQLQVMQQRIADQRALSLDPDIDAHYMVNTAIKDLPEALEKIAQLRGLSNGILAKRNIFAGQVAQLNLLLVELQAKRKVLDANMEETARYNPKVRLTLSNAYQDFNAGLLPLLGRIQSGLLSARFDAKTSDIYDQATVAIDSGYTLLTQTMLPTAEVLLRSRIARNQQELALYANVTCVLLLMAFYAFAGIYYSMVDSIQTLATSAKKFAAGDTSQKVHLLTQDEIGQVGQSFNQMADGFNDMLATRQEDENRLRAIISSALDAVIQMDSAGNVSGWSAQAEVFFGWTAEEVIGKPMHEIIIPVRYRERHSQGLKHFLLHGDGPMLNTRVEIEGLHRKGHEFPIELAISSIQTSAGFEFCAFVRDITQRRKFQESIHKLAFYDPLTDLPNRRLLMDRLQQHMATSARSERYAALLFIDLDNFKALNDTRGHDMGDLLLQQVARRLTSCVREGDTVARLSGDEFVMVLGSLQVDAASAATQIGVVCQKTLASLRQFYDLGNTEYRCTASMGVTLFRGAEISIDELFKQADIAMYKAKESGRNDLRFFDATMQAAVVLRSALEADLRNATGHHQLVLHYQAQVVGNCVCGAEALVRWQHPQRGMVAPADFIPLAEETGIILELGDWVMAAACQQLALWASQPAFTHLTLAVNVSALQFREADFVPKVLAAICRSGARPDRLKLELTESLLVSNVEDVIEKMHLLKLQGVAFSLDDFGTGYSSLTYLKRLPLNQLKIDQSFVRNILTDHDDAAIARTIVTLAENLALAVIAEGVETQAQKDYLATIGCHTCQGYYFSRPLPVDAFERYVQSVKAWPVV